MKRFMRSGKRAAGAVISTALTGLVTLGAQCPQTGGSTGADYSSEFDSIRDRLNELEQGSGGGAGGGGGEQPQAGIYTVRLNVTCLESTKASEIVNKDDWTVKVDALQANGDVSRAEIVQGNVKGNKAELSIVSSDRKSPLLVTCTNTQIPSFDDTVRYLLGTTDKAEETLDIVVDPVSEKFTEMLLASLDVNDSRSLLEYNESENAAVLEFLHTDGDLIDCSEVKPGNADYCTTAIFREVFNDKRTDIADLWQMEEQAFACAGSSYIVNDSLKAGGSLTAMGGGISRYTDPENNTVADFEITAATGNFATFGGVDVDGDDAGDTDNWATITTTVNGDDTPAIDSVSKLSNGWGYGVAFSPVDFGDDVSDETEVDLYVRQIDTTPDESDVDEEDIDLINMHQWVFHFSNQQDDEEPAVKNTYVEFNYDTVDADTDWDNIITATGNDSDENNNWAVFTEGDTVFGVAIPGLKDAQDAYDSFMEITLASDGVVRVGLNDQIDLGEEGTTDGDNPDRTIHFTTITCDDGVAGQADALASGCSTLAVDDGDFGARDVGDDCEAAVVRCMQAGVYASPKAMDIWDDEHADSLQGAGPINVVLPPLAGAIDNKEFACVSGSNNATVYTQEDGSLLLSWPDLKDGDVVTCSAKDSDVQSGFEVEMTAKDCSVE